MAPISTGQFASQLTIPKLDAPSLGTPPAIPTLDVTSLQNQAGITGAKNELQNAQNDLRNFEATLLSEQDKIKGQTVSMAVIGRQSAKLTADMAENYRMKQNAVSEAQNRLQMANQTLSTIMDVQKWNYTQAKDAYDSNFTKAYQLITLQNTLRATESTIANVQQDNARANQAAFLKSVENKAFDANTLTSEIRNALHDIDLQGGYRIGTTEALWEAQSQGVQWDVGTKENNGIIYKSGMKNGVPFVKQIGGIPTKKLIKLTPEKRINLTGIGFSPQEISDIETSVNSYGIEATLKAIDDISQRSIVAEQFNAQEILDKIETAETETTKPQKKWWEFWK